VGFPTWAAYIVGIFFQKKSPEDKKKDFFETKAVGSFSSGIEKIFETLGS